MQDFLGQSVLLIEALKISAHILFFYILIIWAIHIINFALGYRLNLLGIYPRSPFGLLGIIFAPVLHGNFNHLFFNTIPLFVLANFVMLEGPFDFYNVTILIVVISGFLTWLFGRKAIHIGASSLIMGYFSYLLINAYHRPTILGIAIAVVCFYYFAGLIFDLFPSDIRTSWEGHLFGFGAGIAASYLLPYVRWYLV